MHDEYKPSKNRNIGKRRKGKEKEKSIASTPRCHQAERSTE
jgi:hypothetical protein